MTASRAASPVRFAILSVGVTLAAGLLIHVAISRFLVGQAEENVQNVLLTQRGLHRYIQEVMLPEFYRARADGDISERYYAPQALSSTYIVRRMRALDNEERVKAGLEPIYYKLASENPRFPANLADDHEREVLKLFNQDRSLLDHREILTLDGTQYLSYSTPFLETSAACQRCHGDREAAPPGLAALYPGPGGFGEQAGRIRAIESIRAPLESEFRLAWTVTGAISVGLLVFFGLVLFNSRLRDRVRDRTRTLQSEISERQRAEEEVHRLKDSLSAVVDSMPSMLVGLDGEGRVTLWNSQAARTTGLATGQASGRPVGEVLPELAQHLEPLLAGGASRSRPVSRENVAVGTGERRRYYDLLHYPLTVDGQRGGVLRVEDVTRRVQLEAQMVQAQKLEAIGTLAGGIAHDFNNILSAIAGHADLALEQATSATLREDVQAIRDAARRATDLTRQILAFSRQGHQEARLVQPAAIVREALKLLRASIPATIEIQASLDGQATVLADPTDLHRVVVNLCTNAAQAMKEGGRLELSLEEVAVDGPFTASHLWRRPGGSVRLTVRDTGVGMAPEVTARIFEPFFTTRHGEGGTGMGLAMVHGIVQRLGGTISVASEPGAGTTFQIVLPVRSADAGTERGEETTGLPGTERVLFLDDEAVICRVAERSLGRLGYRVTAFSSPLEALAAFEANPDAFDVVVTDMTMPGLTGELVAQRIKARRPGIPVVLCTGYSERAAAEGAEGLGVDQLAMKPMVGAQLSRVIRAVLERR